jgi:hypothetical protein
VLRTLVEWAGLYRECAAKVEGWRALAPSNAAPLP